MFNHNGEFLKLNLKKRLILGFIIIPIISMMFIFIAYGNKTKDIILDNIDNYSGEVLNLIGKNIDLSLETFEKQLDEILYSPLIQDGLQRAKVMTYQNKRDYIDGFDDFLKSKIYLLSSIGEVEILTKDLSILYTQGFKYFERKEIEKYSKLADDTRGTLWFHTEISGEGNVAMVRAIRDTQSKLINGYIFVAINDKDFAKSFLDLDLGSGISINIVDEKNRYLFGQVGNENIVKYRQLIDINSEIIKINEEKYIYKSKKIEGLGWSIVNLIPKYLVEKDIFNTIIGLLFFGIILMIVVFLTTRHIYRGIYNPVEKLIAGVNKVIDGDLDIELDVGNDDEIGVLSRQFKELITKINKLIDDVRYEQKLKRESEIKMLQAQINPHFLFNTLNTLKWIALMNDDKPVSSGLSALAKLLRNTIIDSNEFITIREEIDNIKSYIVIQKLRYGDSFDVKYHISDDIYDKKIIKFILQPIVENSILHGFDETLENQRIDIYISEINEKLEVVIKDNGRGFEVEDSANAKDMLSGIGYKNVEERIILTYGGGHSVKVTSTPMVGTQVKMILDSKN